MKIDLTFEQIDKVIIKELKGGLNYLLDPTQDIHETQENKQVNIDAFLRVLQYYTKPSEYKTFVRKNGL